VLASPSLDEQLEQAGDPAPVNMKSWVDKIKLDYPQCEYPDDEHADENGLLFTSIELYKVRKRLDCTDQPEAKSRRKSAKK
jgi:hypothetical protein